MDRISCEEELNIQNAVRNEMLESYQIFNSWHTYWTEEYKNCVLTNECFELFDKEFFALSPESKKINRDNCTNNGSIPALKSIWLDDNCRYRCDVGTICWTNIRTKNAIRAMSFSNNGNITIKKELYKPTHDIRAHQHIYRSGIEYDATYNVNYNDFDIVAKVINNGEAVDNLEIRLQNGLIYKKVNGIEIIEELGTHMKHIRISQPYNKENKSINSDVEFTATMSNDSKLKSGSLVINTHKGNGKINGTYKMNASQDKGISVKFISRSGKSMYLCDSMQLFGQNNRLRLNGSNQSNKIITDFSTSTQNALKNGTSDRIIRFNSSLFSMDAICEIEDKLNDVLSRIICEVPCSGLINRINNYLAIKNNNKVLKLTQ